MYPRCRWSIVLIAAAALPALYAQEPSPDLPSSIAQSRADDVVETPGGAELQPGENLVRIVRLSQSRGVVQMDRNTGQGFEIASPNMPVVEGSRVRTKQGLAEVEFENNSSVRLTPDTQVDFPELRTVATGNHNSRLNLLQGSLYLSSAPKSDGRFAVACAGRQLTVSPSTHLHLYMDGPACRVTVFSGEAHLERTLGETSVSKKQTLTFNAAADATPTVKKGLISDQWDTWDKTELDYQRHYAAANGFAGAPFSYGMADLNYYGSFTNVAGCGQIWQPYLAGSNWSPYTAGLWSWYPGAGYSYVSLYPWGWLPFHSGQWSFCQSHGWGWQPTGGWHGLRNTHKLNITSNAGGAPLKPPPPPLPHQPTIHLAQASGSMHPSELLPTGSVRFQPGSAGLGVPRGAFNHLDRIATSAAVHGSVSRPLPARLTAPLPGSAMTLGAAGARSSTAVPGSTAGAAQHSSPAMGRMSSAPAPAASAGAAHH